MSLLGNTQQKATAKNAREMIIFSYPKTGKTSSFTQLPGKYLIIDFENGTDFFDCNKVSVTNLEVFNQLREELAASGERWDFIVLDTLTTMYANVINSIAVQIYNVDNKKSKPLDWEIDKLDYGKGYFYKREAMRKVLEFFKSFCNCLILSGHVKESSMDGDNGAIVVKDLDVDGKLKSILALKTDAIGLLSRDPLDNNKNILSFTSSAGGVGGTRIPHLTNKEFVLSEMVDGKLITHWDKIFISNAQEVSK